MRILMLNYEFPPLGGGAANANYYVLKELSKIKDLKIDLITSSPDKFRKEKFSRNITLYKLDIHKKNQHYHTFFEMFSWSIKTLFLVKKLIKKNKYDLCHSWFGWPSGIFGYLFRKKIPYIIGLRGSDVPGFNPRFRLMDKTIWPIYSKVVWKHAKHVIANSIGLKNLAKKTWSGDIDIIYNGINTNEFSPGIKKYEKTTLITVARLIPRKGLDYLVKAMKKIDANLIIIGDGPEKNNLKNLTKNIGVQKKVKFLGQIKHSELAKYYKKSHIAILPSLYEGMSNMILEAMSSGLAIVTTNTGGTAELIKDNGLIIKTKSVDDIIRKVNKLINEKLISKYGKKSRELALDLSWGLVSKKYYDIYQKYNKN